MPQDRRPFGSPLGTHPCALRLNACIRNSSAADHPVVSELLDCNRLSVSLIKLQGDRFHLSAITGLNFKAIDGFKLKTSDNLASNFEVLS